MYPFPLPVTDISASVPSFACRNRLVISTSSIICRKYGLPVRMECLGSLGRRVVFREARPCRQWNIFDGHLRFKFGVGLLNFGFMDKVFLDLYHYRILINLPVTFHEIQTFPPPSAIWEIVRSDFKATAGFLLLRRNRIVIKGSFGCHICSLQSQVSIGLRWAGVIWGG